MSDSVIKVDNLSKRYRIGARQTADTFAEHLTNIVTYPIQNFKRISQLTKFSETEEDTSIFWALRNINFEVSQGEVLGIIGHNGAGKSTLLKILSRITEPTSGLVKIKGRVSALLEVGTGFHPELTGRDNVYMNGTILGMRKREVDAKFDEIVAFSGVQKHIDTPIKFYSSGMKVRLAFSVAAHLEPEILVIDEVLAVGDAEFQKKCLGKMEDVAGQGRTVLFVSHNMAAVESLCTRLLLLKSGAIKHRGQVKEVLNKYLSGYEIDEKLKDRSDRKGNGDFRFLSLEFNNNKAVLAGEDLKIKITYESIKPIENLNLAFTICRSYEDRLMVIDNVSQGETISIEKGKGEIEIIHPNIRLLPHAYSVNLWSAHNSEVLDYILDAGKLQIVESDIYNTGKILNTKKHGYFASNKSQWIVK